MGIVMIGMELSYLLDIAKTSNISISVYASAGQIKNDLTSTKNTNLKKAVWMPKNALHIQVHSQPKV